MRFREGTKGFLQKMHSGNDVRRRKALPFLYERMIVKHRLEKGG